MLLKIKDPITKEYDVIVIGSGLAGMTAANRLAQLGRSVLLLESHNKLGGFATWFWRRQKGNHTFDISLHGFPYGMVKTCRKYWSKEIAQKIVQVKDVRFINPQFELTTSFSKDDYIAKLTDHFGVAKQTVLDFFDHLAQMNFYDQDQSTNQELFEKYFPGRNDIVRFLMEPITYANGSDLNDPAITYGIVFSNFMNKGVYTFEGGTQNIINMMKEELIKNGVDIKLHSKVEKIIIEDGLCKGVHLNGNEIKSKAVISNSNIKSTVFNLCGEKYFSADFLQKAKDIRLNSSSSQVYMGIKEGESIPYVGELVFTSTHPTYDWEKVLDFKITSRTYSIYYPDLRPDLGNRTTIVASINHRWEDWKDLDDEQYELAKQDMIKSSIEELDKIIPGIESKIDFVEAATPRTVKRYTLHPNGASFGTKFEGLPISMNISKEVAGLYHSGSVGIIMSGWLGAANYGVITANEIERFFYETYEKQNIAGEIHV
jgi:phytoene dehydrogenase-like protein